MLEHQPKDLGNRVEDTEQAVIKHVNAHLSLSSKDGTIEPEMPACRMPLRQVWAGKREIEGDRPGLFHISIFEVDVKTWMMRIHDNSLCKMYSHVVPKDLLNDHEDLADADNKDDWVTDPIRVSVALERLRFEGCVLSIQKISRQNASALLEPAVRKTQNTKELQSIQSNTLWPRELVVNMANRLGKDSKYMLVRASASPTQNLLGIILYEPIEKLLFEQVFCFSEICVKQANYESMKDRKSLEILWRKMATTALQAQDKTKRHDRDSMSDSDDSQRGSPSYRRPLESGNNQTPTFTALGVSGQDYTKSVEELLDGLRLTDEDKMAFRFELDDVTESRKATNTTSVSMDTSEGDNV